MGLLMFAYPITRFLIEFLRNDEPAFFAGLTISQAISVGLVLCAIAYWSWLRTCPGDRRPASASDVESPAAEPAAAQA
jgi:phosphatidylglycerol:prolipoprotein diacylglycerol transferase